VNNRRVILALDLEPPRAYEVASEVRDLVLGFKVGWHLLLEEGVKAVEKVSKLNYTIVDVKLADVPHVLNYVVSKLVDHGAGGVIVHGFLGEFILRKLREVRCDVYLVAAMTEESFYDDHVIEITSLAVELGFRGVVLPGNRPWIVKIVRELFGDRITVLAPGIGPQGGRARDAIRAGANAVIVGREVFESPSPREKLLEILAELP